VTLITGDRVIVFPSGGFTVTRAPGRENVDFFTSRAEGKLRVVPSDAARLVGAGRLDQRLFNVTELIEQGYDDQRTGLPLIIGAGAGSEALPKATTKVSSDAATQVRTLPKVRMVTVEQRRARANTFWKRLTGGTAHTRTLDSTISHVWLDAKGHLLMDHSVPQIGAPTAWQAGYTGKGVTVAVLDSGADATHPDLAPQIASSRNFTPEPDADRVGHGTHVASTIAGTGAASNGRYRGVAPEARLAIGKVCDLGDCQESWVIAGMQWAAAEARAKVISMSLGWPDAPGLTPQEEAVESLSAQYGTLFVVAAGNSGEDSSVSRPASAPSALAVAAVDKSDALAFFSSRGPRVGDDALKPEISAPGVEITAARSQQTGTAGEMYTSMSGTSMATPHVAGAAALLAQRHPEWTGQQLKATLMGTAVPNSSTGVYAQGAGRVDVVKALASSVTTEPAGISFGRPHYPHPDDQLMSSRVTYRNSGSAPVSLRLSITASVSATGDTAGAPAPEGMLQVSPATVELPAQGEAAVTITANTSLDSPDGYVGGYLTAAGDDLLVRTPVAVHKEVESYDLTLRHLDRAGAATGNYHDVLISTDCTKFFEVYPSDSGVTTLRVPKGTYLLSSVLAGAYGNSTDRSVLVQPRLDLFADQTLAIDARSAQPVSVDVNVPDGPAASAGIVVGWSQTSGTASAGAGFLFADPANLFTGQLGSTFQPAPGFTSQISGVWGEKTDDGVSAKRFTVNLGWFGNGTMLSGLTRRVTTTDLAVVRTSRAGTIPRSEGMMVASPQQPGRMSLGGIGVMTPLPNTGTDYFNTENGIAWTLSLEEIVGDWEAAAFTEYPSRRFEAGHHYKVNFNEGVFGPTLKPSDATNVGVWRDGDTVSVRMPLYGDGQGNLGDSMVSAHELTLSPAGTPIGQSSPGWGSFTVPAGDQRYQLTASARRDSPFALSTQITGVWGFRSGHVTSQIALPLYTVGFAPRLDDTNTARAGQRLTVPLRIDSQPGAAVGTLRTVNVEVSFDDGATWKPLPVDSCCGKKTVTVSHPSGSGFVSLRVNAADSDGNTVTETIIHAYRYAPKR
jgi:hypothetical protein